MLHEKDIDIYWHSIPVGKVNAVSYFELIARWGVSEREVRRILQILSALDNGDDYVLIRSAMNGGGFYRTNSKADINAYRKECLNKANSMLMPLKKMNRVLKIESNQISIDFGE